MGIWDGLMPLYVLVDRVPVRERDFATWLYWKAFAEEQCRVGDDSINDVRVSTVFLGMDHNWTRHGPPILFETMAFAREDGAPMGQWRSSTWAEAEAMHSRICSKYRMALARAGTN